MSNDSPGGWRGRDESPGKGQILWRDGGDGLLSIEVTRRDTYPVAIGRGMVHELPRLLTECVDSDEIVVITDENVAALWLERVSLVLATLELPVQSLVVSPGEASKSWRSAQTILETLSRLGVRRRTVLVALGGGVISDLVGFVASMFMRGLPYVNVPTTLMAQLDASVGGKTGIDFDGSKNLVGAFYHPAAVLIDPDFLATLERREVCSGLAEAVKVGILYPGLFEKLEQASASRLDDADLITSITTDAVLAKLELLQEDPFERSLTRSLNLGHTFGHALEAATDFAVYRHGEAVALGIAVATVVSRFRGLCSWETERRILMCLENCGLGVSFPQALVDATWDGLEVIRRIRNGRLNEVLPVTIGQVMIVDEIGRAEFEFAVNELRHHRADHQDQSNRATSL